MMSRAHVPDSLLRVNRSCLECRRRKIRCDGNQPCNSCTWYQAQPNCQYLERKKRKLASQRIDQVNSISQTPADRILDVLFPGRSVKYLATLSRTELLRLAESVPRQLPSEQSLLGSPEDQGADSDDQHEWDEHKEVQDPSTAMCDDVNGLSLHLYRRSYMGISSVHAILRTIFRLRPSLQQDMIKPSENAVHQIISPPKSYTSPSDLTIENSVPSIDEQTSIDAYFTHLQGVIPILDEKDFRMQWKRGDRSDGPWIALLNMVLVMGSISTGDTDDRSHQIYYMRAKPYLDLEFLGTGCMESLQALILLGGCYLHYKNSPNMAHTILGAAYRIAVGLGLHREHGNTNATPQALGTNWRPYMRRRIWWSLFCVDTWTCMTLGRPTLGRWDMETMNVSSAQDRNAMGVVTDSLRCSQEFCHIATRIQHRFAQLLPISTAEIADFDAELQTWYQSLPQEFRQPRTCPEHLLTGQYFMRNRYFNLRLLLHRPVLLSYANRRVPLNTLQPDEQDAIQRCQEMACSAIDQVSWVIESMNSLRVWSGVWYLYQASMVVVLSLIVDPSHPESEKWRASTEQALSLFQTMVPWARAADRSRQVLASIYDVCAEALNGYSNVGVDDIDMTVWDQLGSDTFAEGWHWDPPVWQNDGI